MYKIRVYKKDLEYTYALGVFPTIELLKNKPDEVDQVMISSQGDRNAGISEIDALCHQHNIPLSTNDHKIRLLAPKENTYAVGVLRNTETS